MSFCIKPFFSSKAPLPSETLHNMQDLQNQSTGQSHTDIGLISVYHMTYCIDFQFPSRIIPSFNTLVKKE